MKISLKIVASVLFIGAFAVVGCKKDNPTPTELLATGSCWQMTLLEGYDTANNIWVAVPIDDCAADNCFAFKTDQSFTVNEGTAKCDPDDPQIAAGTWSISEDGKKLALSDDISTEVGTIIELSRGKLVYETTFDEEKIRITMHAN